MLSTTTSAMKKPPSAMKPLKFDSKPTVSHTSARPTEWVRARSDVDEQHHGTFGAQQPTSAATHHHTSTTSSSLSGDRTGASNTALLRRRGNHHAQATPTNNNNPPGSESREFAATSCGIRISKKTYDTTTVTRPVMATLTAAAAVIVVRIRTKRARQRRSIECAAVSKKQQHPHLPNSR